MLNIFIPIFLMTTSLDPICYTDKGTEYGQKGSLAYTETNHGPDGSLFLDPYFKPAIEKLNNHRILDAGCGAAPWSIYAAKNGGRVYAIDIQENMIQNAKHAIQCAQVDDKVMLIKGDVADLPFDNDFFDRIISICVACNLPLESFDRHFLEMQRTLKQEGIAMIGAPSSLDIVFTNDSMPDNVVFSHIDEILNQLPNDPSPEQIADQLIQLEEIRSATFFIKDHRLILLKDENEIVEGEKIWRKLSNVIVPNYYYSLQSYAHTLKKHYFNLQKMDLPHFKNEEERIAYNNMNLLSKLGSTYTSYAPFVIFEVRKKVAQK